MMPSEGGSLSQVDQNDFLVTGLIIAVSIAAIGVGVWTTSPETEWYAYVIGSAGLVGGIAIAVSEVTEL